MSDQNKEGEISMEDISQAMKFLVDRMGEMGKVIHNQGEVIGLLKTNSERETQRLTDERSVHQESEEVPDLDSMSNSELVQHITGSLREEIAAPLQQAIQSVGQRSEGRAIRNELQEASVNNKYFEQFRPELQAHLKANPNLSIDDAYHVVAGRNPGKMQELLQADADRAAEAAKSELDEKRKQFGGLTPTSGKTVGNDKMSADEAGEAAWQETMGDRMSVEGALQ